MSKNGIYGLLNLSQSSEESFSVRGPSPKDSPPNPPSNVHERDPPHSVNFTSATGGGKDGRPTKESLLLEIRQQNCSNAEVSSRSINHQITKQSIISKFRTSPEEFLNRLADLEKEKKGVDGSSDERGRGFSLPTKPKAPSKAESSMKREKVRKRNLES